MVAKITLSGSRAAEYRLEISLPQEWINQFSQNGKVFVYGESLHEQWGLKASSGTRYKSNYLSTLEDAEVAIKSVQTEIAEAKKALNDHVNKEIFIDL